MSILKKLSVLLTAIAIMQPSFALPISEIKELVPDLKEWATDPAIVSAVSDANQVFKTRREMNALDREWQEYQGISPLMLSMLESKAAQKLLEFEQSKPFYKEIFITDKFGANVAMTSKTSDYWQGDEQKFSKCFNKGKGTVFVSKSKFDTSTQKNLVQISIPILNGEDTIGVMVVGINSHLYENFDDK